MRIMHLTASTFYGGPERQILGLAEEQAPYNHSIIVSFSEGGRSRELMMEARKVGCEAHSLAFDTPKLWAALKELKGLLREYKPDILCCHGYKADILGLVATRRTGTAAIAISRGWTGENRRVRVYERLDRMALRLFKKVVCVSEGQARKVKKAGVSPSRIVVIANAVRSYRLRRNKEECRERVAGLFSWRPRFIVGAAGRLSPEKGFPVFIEAARGIVAVNQSVGFLIFGEGPGRTTLDHQIDHAGLGEKFVLAGFRRKLEDYLPGLDLLVQSSHTEGMPNVVLEAMATGVPVAATEVGGTPELIQDGITGLLVSPGDAGALKANIEKMLGSESLRQDLSRRALERVSTLFTFEKQAQSYHKLFEEIVASQTSDNQESGILQTLGAA